MDSHLTTKATRWGICSAGCISRDFSHCLKSLPSSEHEIVAVAARDLKRAQSFAKDFGILTAYGSYLELAKDPDVDVVYIGTIHPEHHRVTLLFISHGKNVLVEKPAAMNLKQLKEMTSLAKEKKVFFMEAVWTRFFPLYQRILNEMSNETIGKARVLRLELAIPISNRERIRSKVLGGGALLDMGVYPLNIAVFLFGKPDDISVQGTMMGDTEVDEGACVIFKYNDGRMAQLLYNVTFKGMNEGVIYGTHGQIKIHNPFWCPTEVTLPSGKMTFDLPKINHAKFIFHNRSGLTYQAMHVRQCLLEGLKESPVVPVSHSEYVMDLVDKIKSKIGLRYDVDE